MEGGQEKGKKYLSDRGKREQEVVEGREEKTGNRIGHE